MYQDSWRFPVNDFWRILNGKTVGDVIQEFNNTFAHPQMRKKAVTCLEAMLLQENYKCSLFPCQRILAFAIIHYCRDFSDPSASCLIEAACDIKTEIYERVFILALLGITIGPVNKQIVLRKSPEYFVNVKNEDLDPQSHLFLEQIARLGERLKPNPEEHMSRNQQPFDSRSDIQWPRQMGTGAGSGEAIAGKSTCKVTYSKEVWESLKTHTKASAGRIKLGSVASTIYPQQYHLSLNQQPLPDHVMGAAFSDNKYMDDATATAVRNYACHDDREGIHSHYKTPVEYLETNDSVREEYVTPNVEITVGALTGYYYNEEVENHETYDNVWEEDVTPNEEITVGASTGERVENLETNGNVWEEDVTPNVEITVGASTGEEVENLETNGNVWEEDVTPNVEITVGAEVDQRVDDQQLAEEENNIPATEEHLSLNQQPLPDHVTGAGFQVNNTDGLLVEGEDSENTEGQYSVNIPENLETNDVWEEDVTPNAEITVGGEVDERVNEAAPTPDSESERRRAKHIICRKNKRLRQKEKKRLEYEQRQEQMRVELEQGKGWIWRCAQAARKTWVWKSVS